MIFPDRTHYCGSVTKEKVDQTVTVMGWVHQKRVVGKKLAFIDLRDREGIIQLVFTQAKIDIEGINKISLESVIWATGKVVMRKNANPELKTGEIEVLVEQYELISNSLDLPFAMHGFIDVQEEVRQKFRYIDLRRPEILSKSVQLRHKTSLAIWNTMDSMGFYHVETPILLKSTPEGARDFLVPSRIHQGKFYALPQSPQILKQLLMVGGIDKYFQIAKCFRDEDLRADRQPEFTQIDIEMSFIKQEDIFRMAEILMQDVFKNVLQVELITPFPRFTYQEVKSKYGSDKPDLRIKNYYVDIDKKKLIKAKMKLNEGEQYKILTVKGITDEELQKIISDSGLTSEQVQIHDSNTLIVKTNAKGYLSDEHENLRRLIGKKTEKIAENEFNFSWVVDFPLFDWSENDQKITPSHHPFTAPNPDDVELLDEQPLNVRAYAYDLILNGYEIGGGSIRIHNSELQKKIFELINLKIEEAEMRFGFLLEALKYGAPPHGGMAFGLDRLLMVMAGEESIKEVITFSKTKIETDLLSGAPDTVDKEQLDELGIKLK